MRNRWVPSMLFFAAVYAVVGVVTAALARSPQVTTFWRLAAWLLSLVAFLSHIAYEHFRLRNNARTLALHVATAVALGGFVLAAAGPVRTYWGRPRFWQVSVLSLVLWPILTGVPAFLAALVAAFILGRLGVRDKSPP